MYNMDSNTDLCRKTNNSFYSNACGRCVQSTSSLQALDFCALNLKEEEKVKSDKKIVAVDLGTTTIAMQLRRIDTGEVLDTYVSMNPQRKYGLDVLSRITKVCEEDMKEEMRQAAWGCLESGIRQFQEFLLGFQSNDESEIAMVTVAGNTTMVHLLIGLSVSKLGTAPFEAETLDEISTEILGIPMLILPGFSAFVGGDLMAGVYASKMDLWDEKVLFIDLGTNGEILLGNKEKILATATAAAPAFEGAATNGIWGADFVKIIAELLKKKIVDETGLLADPYFEHGVDVFHVHVTQKHIRYIQMAKAAVRAGIQVLLDNYGIKDCKEIHRVFLAGGFGYYLDGNSAIRIGLIPVELEGKIIAVGNSALEGAFWYGRENYIKNNYLESRILKLKEKTKVLNLAKQPEFEEIYLSFLQFPAE